MPANTGVSGSVTRYTDGYRELEDSLQDDFSQYSSEYTAAVHWASPVLGSFNLGYSQSMNSGGGNTRRFLNASWGRKFGRINVNVSVIEQLNHDDENEDADDEDNGYVTHDGSQVYLNLSFPLGEQRITAYSHKQHDATTTGVQASGDIGSDLSYSVSAGQESDGHENDFNGNLNSNMHYTRLGFSAGKNGTDDKNIGVTINGAVVAHDKGITFSPYPVRDSFAIADIGNHVSNIGITTPSGKVWTDYWGRAVIPSLRPYHSARVEIDTTSLPDNIDIDNGYGNVAVGHGAVSKVKFHISSVHRAMLKITMPDGSLPGKNTMVVDKAGNYAGTVIDDGMLFINDIDKTNDLFVQNEEGKNICQITYHLGPQKKTLYFIKRQKAYVVKVSTFVDYVIPECRTLCWSFSRLHYFLISDGR